MDRLVEFFYPFGHDRQTDSKAVENSLGKSRVPLFILGTSRRRAWIRHLQLPPSKLGLFCRKFRSFDRKSGGFRGDSSHSKRDPQTVN